LIGSFSPIGGSAGPSMRAIAASAPLAVQLFGSVPE
jgi:hypothetical protein